MATSHPTAGETKQGSSILKRLLQSPPDVSLLTIFHCSKQGGTLILQALKLGCRLPLRS